MFDDKGICFVKSRLIVSVLPTTGSWVDHSIQARLNVVAGATDASRAMLLTLCRKVELLTAIFGFL
jgi:hypothetical protein